MKDDTAHHSGLRALPPSSSPGPALPPPDNRSIHRIPVRLVVSQGGRSAPLGRTRDVSLEGLFVETAAPLAAGGVVPLSLELDPQGAPLEVTAEIVRVTPEGMGLRFMGLDRGAAKRLKRWIVDLTSVQGTQRLVEQLHDQERAVEPVTQPQRLTEILAIIAAQAEAVTLVPADRVARDQGRLVADTPEGLVFETVAESSLQVGEEVFALLSVDFVSYSFGARVLAVEGRRIRCARPTAIVHSERRTQDRVATAGAVLRWPCPWDREQDLVLPVVERGVDGLSFRAPVAGCLLGPGAPLHDAALVVGGRAEPLPSAEVRHLTLVDTDGEPWLRVGVAFGSRRPGLDAVELAAAPAPRRTGPLAWLLDRLGWLRKAVSYSVHTGRQRILPAADGQPRRVRIPQGELEIVGLLNQSHPGPERLRCPLVVVVPGFAGRKEQFSLFAQTVVEGFRHQHQDVAVLRIDTTNNLGESGRDPGCEGEGRQALHYTVSGSVRDVLACLAWARDNPFVDPSHVILVTASMASVAARHALTRPEAAGVGLWVSYMGAADAVDTVRNVSGNIDLHAYWQRGQRLGVVSLGGVLTDGDHFWADLDGMGLGPLEVAQREMEQVRADVVWIRGKHDAWMDPRRVRRLMEARSPGRRELIEVDSGHIPKSGEEALGHFVRITQRIWQHVHHAQLAPFRPSLGRLGAASDAEWARVSRRPLEDGAGWWRRYLLDDGIGFDILELAPPYADFMDAQAALLEPAGARVLDLGAGTGNLTARVLAAGAAHCVAVDLVPEALARVKTKVADDPRLELRALDLGGTPRLAIERFVTGDLRDLRLLAARVPGLHGATVDRLLEAPDDALYGALLGRALDPVAIARRRRLPTPAAALLADLHCLARVARGAQPAETLEDALEALPAALFRRRGGLPFPDAQFDAVGMSLLLSYLDHPEDLLYEAFRVLRPGGRLVISSMVVDADSSKLYLDLLARCEALPEAQLPEGQTREALIASARTFVDRAAELFRIEEEGLFRFYDGPTLSRMVRLRGFEAPQIVPGFGDPAQAVIVACRKPEALPPASARGAP